MDIRYEGNNSSSTTTWGTVLPTDNGLIAHGNSEGKTRCLPLHTYKFLYGPKLQFMINIKDPHSKAVGPTTHNNNATIFATFPNGPNQKSGFESLSACVAKEESPITQSGFGYAAANTGCQIGTLAPYVGADSGGSYSVTRELDFFEINVFSGLMQITYYQDNDTGGDAHYLDLTTILGPGWQTQDFILQYEILADGLNIRASYSETDIDSAAAHNITWAGPPPPAAGPILDWQKYIESTEGWAIYVSLNPDYLPDLTGGTHGLLSVASDFIVYNIKQVGCDINTANTMCQSEAVSGDGTAGRGYLTLQLPSSGWVIILNDCIEAYKNICYQESTVSNIYRSLNNIAPYDTPPGRIQTIDPDELAAIYSHYLPSQLISNPSYQAKQPAGEGIYPLYLGDQSPDISGLYTADQTRLPWRLSNYVRAFTLSPPQPDGEVIYEILLAACKALSYSFYLEGHLEYAVNIYLLTQTDAAGMEVGIIMPLMAGITALIQKDNDNSMNKFLNDFKNPILSLLPGYPGFPGPPLDWYYQYKLQPGGAENNQLYPFFNTLAGGGQQLGLMMTGLGCTAQFLYSPYNIMASYDDKPNDYYPLPYPANLYGTGLNKANIDEIIDLYYKLAFAGHNFGTNGPTNPAEIQQKGYYVSVRLAGINVKPADIDKYTEKPLFDIWSLPDQAWNGNCTAEIFSYQLIAAVITGKYDYFCKLHRFFYYCIYLQNGGQMDQNAKLWQATQPYNSSQGGYVPTAPPHPEYRWELPNPGTTIAFGDPGNWQPDYYQADYNAPSGAGYADISFSINTAQYSDAYKATNRYLICFAFPSWCMGYGPNWTNIGVESTPPISDLDNKTILNHGPYAHVKNVFYPWKMGNELRSATDADANIWMAYRLAELAAQRPSSDPIYGAWKDKDDNPFFNNPTPADLDPKAAESTGYDVSWKSIREQIGISMYDSSGGYTGISYQNNNGNFVEGGIIKGRHVATQGHDTDYTQRVLHADYMDLRLMEINTKI